MRTSMTPSCLSCASLDRVFMEIIPCRPQHAVAEGLIPAGTGIFSISGPTQYSTRCLCTRMPVKGEGDAAKGADTLLCSAWVDTGAITARGSQRFQ